MSGLSITSLGIKAANELTENDDKAPRPTKVFIFGAPLKRLFIPSKIRCLPGPSNVNKDKVRWNPVEWKAWYHAALAPKKWERWPNRQTAHKAHEKASSRPIKVKN